MPTFDPLEPFKNKKLLKDVVDKFRTFEYKLYGKIPIRFYRGRPTIYEFDLNLGLIHFTELDCNRLSAIFSEINKKWGTEMTFCIYPAKEKNRNMIINVRGSPKAPSEIN